ncbi:MAG: 1-deoxy-D-xylulose-5-phosphate reductoisomerase [Parachlamydia sp.]|nr:MAG: 1-deoxy-D-xylulose-5-phosphate reductoisomerase [Parachlamydia sp.]
MKKIALLGSTGSIGQSTLQVARHLQDSVRVVALAAHSNIDLLEQQAREFLPDLIAVYDTQKASELKKRLPGFKIVPGKEGLNAVAAHPEAEQVVSAISGTIGLCPTIAAIEAGKHVALANKEALVSGGALVMSLVKEKGVQLLPVDSEHSAIFQCLNGEDLTAIRRLILTASGGPFRLYSADQLAKITVEQALNHPNWKMGSKITIDCSTLMNKGLEVIEAYWLFNIPLNQIEVIIHPQSIIHSMVEFVDGSIIAQMGEPNMIVPIQYALTYPKRSPGMMQPFNFEKFCKLDFTPPNTQHFKCLSLAYESIKQGGSLACYMNAANETLVNRFLQREIGWQDIALKLEQLMLNHRSQHVNSLDDILEIDREARQIASDA